MKPCLFPHLTAFAAFAALGLAAVPAAHAQQSLYAANYGDNTITEFNSQGVGTQFNVSGNLNSPSALAFGPAGNLFVANLGDNTIEELNSADVGTQFNVSGNLDGIGGIAFDSAGNLFVANINDSTIEEFNSAGVGHQFSTGGDTSETFGLAVGPSTLPAAVPEASTTVSLGLLLTLGLSEVVVAAKRRTRA